MTTALLTYSNRDRYDVSSLKWAIGGGGERRKGAFTHLQNFSKARATLTLTV